MLYNKRKNLKIPKNFLASFLTLFILFLQIPIIYGENSAIQDARSEVYKAFQALAEAYDTGGNVSGLVRMLNRALELVDKAEITFGTDPDEAQGLAVEAKTLAFEVIRQAPLIREGGLKQTQTHMIIVVTSVTSLLIAGVLIYKFGPELLWRIWLWFRRDYLVKVSSAKHVKEKNSVITIEHICAAILGITLIISTFAVSQYFLGGRISEPFSELGILGPNMKIGDYPKDVVAGETIRLYLYIGNQMGKPVYYIVNIKLGDNSTPTDPAPIEPFMKFERILLHNETWLTPADITITHAGTNQRLIFELWIYNQTTNQMQYHQRWGQIWFNATAPPA
jgi:hypothetical protein